MGLFVCFLSYTADRAFCRTVYYVMMMLLIVLRNVIARSVSLRNRVNPRVCCRREVHAGGMVRVRFSGEKGVQIQILESKNRFFLFCYIFYKIRKRAMNRIVSAITPGRY